MIDVKKVSEKKDLIDFVKFPFKLYKESKYWVPPITDQEINNKYKQDKETKYKIDPSVTVQYKLWKNINATDIDSLDIIDLQDSLLQLSIDFASDAQTLSFNEALDLFEDAAELGIDPISTAGTFFKFINDGRSWSNISCR